MTEASVFYEAASVGLGFDFLDDVQRVIDTIREHPELGRAVGKTYGKSCYTVSHSVSFIRPRNMQSSWSQLRINVDVPAIGKAGMNHNVVLQATKNKTIQKKESP